MFLMEFIGSIAVFYFIFKMEDETELELTASLDYFRNYSDVQLIWNTMQQNASIYEHYSKRCRRVCRDFFC